MPFPHLVIIYLREKGIPPSLVTVVPISDPQLGDAAPANFLPRPKGSLPILVIPPPEHDSNTPPTYIRQSVAIMNYVNEHCNAGANGFPKSQYSMLGADALSRARETELLTLAYECTVGWNPIRAFGSGAGTLKVLEASKEMIRWIYQPLATIEGFLKERGDLARLRKGGRWVRLCCISSGVHEGLLWEGYDASGGEGEGCLWARGSGELFILEGVL
jgi:glutathione S-transferase